MKKVVAFGVFDNIDPNHVHHLNEAKEYGDYLVVVILPDKILELQKTKVSRNEGLRRKDVEDLKIADKVIIGHCQIKYQIVAEEKPDIIAIGHYQKILVDELTDRIDEKVQIVRTSPFIPKS